MNVTYSAGYSKNGTDSNMVERAVAAARQADVAIVVAGLNHSRYQDDEGWDRTNLCLPYGQDELIQQVVEANPRTIVVLVSGPAIELGPWLAQVPAVLQAHYSGMEGGHALARILFGEVNPSGKLTVTYPKQLSDSPAHALGTYPGTNGTLFYKEGLLVGYRWFDTKKIEPAFPFGFGLSYTTFEVFQSETGSRPGTNGPIVTAQFEIANTGSRAGAEVAQLYVHQETSERAAAAERTERVQKSFPEAGRKTDRLHPARSTRLRLLRPGENRLGVRSRRLRNSGRQLVARHSPARHVPSGPNHSGEVNAGFTAGSRPRPSDQFVPGFPEGTLPAHRPTRHSS